MKKSKLDRIMERNDNKVEIDISVLDKAKTRLEDRTRTERVQKSLRWGVLARVLVPLCCVIIIIVSIILIHPSNSDSSLPPVAVNPETPEVSEGKYYAASDENQRNILSVNEFMKEKNISLKYFDLSNSKETLVVYEDPENEKDQDVLLWQRMLLLEKYEEIKLYVELQDNYIFDFLTRFSNLGQECEINGVAIKYDTVFDKDYYLFCTRTTFEIDGFKYRVEFFMEDSEQWRSYLGGIL